ncbi:MAG: oxygen-independent coproporphyrinogen III oxidase [Chitinophagaceae bacterium]|nr:MAG: oxygen-independent coproporphyrinogen III oxidase [Chitinophagaceae bacterium]
MTQEMLLKKYNREVPRYTSYPTVPFWKEWMHAKDYVDNFKTNFDKYNQGEGISLYLHLPFCESLCSFCGCNKLITANHDVEEKYLNAVIGEWYLYRRLMGAKPIIRELHLGGGTPTFFSPGNLKRMLDCIFDIADIHPQRAFSLEGHPNNTTRSHLEILQQFGFTRISLGVQDYDPDVQRVINRIQPYENVEQVTQWARQTGFTSVNHDLIYGLPLQTLTSVKSTIEKTIALHPDRIAYYSYAHVPWIKKNQRLYDENDLPTAEQKMKFYLFSRSLLLLAGYEDIGMDHFALPGDSLYKASLEGGMHRNFMGYTTSYTPFLIGLGVSAISDTGSAYSQNCKELTNYYRKIDNSELPLQQGYILDETEVGLRKYIMDIACKGSVIFEPEHTNLLNTYVIPELKELANDGLIILGRRGLKVTGIGKMFLRNICQAFDLKWKWSQSKSEIPRFSRSV